MKSPARKLVADLPAIRMLCAMKRIVGCFALGLAILSCARGAAPGAKFGTLAAGTLAPDFVVIGAQGKELRLSDFKEKTVILNFWTPNRGPAEALQVAFLNYAELGVVVLGICSTGTREEFDAWVAKTKGTI